MSLVRDLKEVSRGNVRHKLTKTPTGQISIPTPEDLLLLVATMMVRMTTAEDLSEAIVATRQEDPEATAMVPLQVTVTKNTMTTTSACHQGTLEALVVLMMSYLRDQASMLVTDPSRWTAREVILLSKMRGQATKRDPTQEVGVPSIRNQKAMSFETIIVSSCDCF